MGVFSDLFVIPEELDFQNTCYVAFFIAVFLFELVYCCSPQFLKNIIVDWDYNKSKGHSISYTACFAGLTLLGIMVSQGQLMSEEMSRD